MLHEARRLVHHFRNRRFVLSSASNGIAAADKRVTHDCKLTTPELMTPKSVTRTDRPISASTTLTVTR